MKKIKAKKEKLSLELEIIHKFLDSISWNILGKYFEERKNKELYPWIKEKTSKSKAKKEMERFLKANPNILGDIGKIRPASGLPTTQHGFQLTFGTLEELKEKTNESPSL